MAAVLGIAVALGLAACTPDGQPPPEHRHPGSRGPVLLEMAVYGPPQVITAYAKIAADFTAEQPEVVVNVRPFDDHEAARQAVSAAFAAGDPPDLFLVDGRDLPGLERRRDLRPVGDLLEKRQVDFGDGFVRGALEAFSADSALQCMPMSYSPLVVYYNTDLVRPPRSVVQDEKPNEPTMSWTLEQFARAATRASRHGHKGVYVAPDLTQVAPFVWSGGGEVADSFTRPTRLTLSDGSSQKALEELLEIVRNPRLTYDRARLDQRSALDRFESGQLGMLLGFRGLTHRLRQQRGLHFDVMPLPVLNNPATIASSTGMCLARGTPHRDAEGDFLAYLTSDHAMSVLAGTGYVVPTSLDVAASAAFQQPGEMPAHARVFTEQLRYVQHLPNPDRWPEVAAVAERGLRRLFYRPVVDPLDQHLAALDARTARVLAPAGVPSPEG